VDGRAHRRRGSDEARGAAVDQVSGNDIADGGENTDTCVVDAGDAVTACELS
jgi:hypothetical protein